MLIILLDENGNLPNGLTKVDIARLESTGEKVLLVHPVQQPERKEGYILVEGPPEERDGAFYQTWLYEPAPEAPPPTFEDVNLERDRRLRGTIPFMGTVFDCDAASLQRITGAATLAGFAIGRGAAAGDLYWHGGPEPFTWISNENVPVEMDAFATFKFGQVAAANETAHIVAARALKDMKEIPRDFQDDKWWP